MNENEKQVHIYHCTDEGCKYGDPDCPVYLVKSRWGAHETHCCPIHGCKYGDRRCPVTKGLTYGVMCEECEDEVSGRKFTIIFKDETQRTVNTYHDLFTLINNGTYPVSTVKDVHVTVVHSILHRS